MSLFSDILSGNFLGVQSKTFGAESGKGNKQVGETLTAPWSEQQPYLKEIFQQAQQLSKQPLQYYGGPTVAGFTPEQQMAQQLAAARALAGSPLLRTAQEETLKTMRGDYLNPANNAGLMALYNRGLQETLANIRGSAAAAGRSGSDTEALLSGQALADLTANIYAPERQYMLGATQFAPQLAEADYSDIGRLSAVGTEKQAMEQALINDAMRKFEFQQLEPWQRLGLYMNLIQGEYGGVTDSEARKRGK